MNKKTHLSGSLSFWRLMAVLVISLCLYVPNASAEPIQWKVEDGGTGNWYDVVWFYTNWEGAYVHSQTQYWKDVQGHLATITSLAEQNFICNNLSFGNAFLGGYQVDTDSEPDGGWVWITGEPWVYTNWATGEPNNDFNGVPENYLGFHGEYKEGGWNDFSNTFNWHYYIIEFEVSEAPSIPEDITSPAGAIHAYPNTIWPPNGKNVIVKVEGYLFDELSAYRDGDGFGVASAYLLIDGSEEVVLTDVLDNEGRFSVDIEVVAEKGATYLVELFGSDTNPEAPNTGLVDFTVIHVGR